MATISKQKTMDELVEECRETIREIEVRLQFLQKHGFQEEVRILNVKIGGMFQIYDMLANYMTYHTNV